MNLSRTVRARLYEIAIAAVLVAVGYGLLTEADAHLWLGLTAAVLGVARANVPPAE